LQKLLLKLAYYRKYCIGSNQILHSNKVIKTKDHETRASHYKSKMADGRHLEKKIENSLYFNHDLTDCHEIWHSDAV